MNFRDLEYIIEASKTLSFSKAARNCNVSQPSLSAQIKKLENELGVQIFYRNKRSVSLTAYGEIFVKKAKDIISIKQDLIRASLHDQDPMKGKLRLGGIITIAPYMFPKIIHQLDQSAPKLTLSLKEAKTEELLKDLLDNKIDAALISLPTDTNVFENCSLFTEPFYLGVSENYMISENPSNSDEILRNKDLILLEEGHCFRSQALDVCHSLSAKENKVFNGTSLETIRQFISTGKGMTLMPAMAVKENDGLKYFHLNNTKYSREIGMVWRKSCNKKPQIENIIACIRNMLPELTRVNA